MRTALLTFLALVAFAANSVIARLALGVGTVDGASFSVVRLTAGAAVLGVLVLAMGERPAGDWPSAAALFLYAVPFSFAYLSLATGTGALILFASVQGTMIGLGLARGERPRPLEWAGLAVAFAGLVYLVSPGLAAPSPTGSLMMALAGAAWGVYSLRGRGTNRPVAVTAGNFLRAVPLAAAVLCAVAVLGDAGFAGAAPGPALDRLGPASWGLGGGLGLASGLHLTARGAFLAVLSGAVTSGLGYVVWYAALRGLTATRAATLQLAVPVLAAGGGVALLGEPVTLRLVIATLLILGGLGLALRSRRRPPALAVAAGRA
ncbi:MAG TPA: DMT family transporter [Thermoanaerobaculia bacterium]|nr:DMT family transporter [Thermoanaerobaculia bacterium]